MKDKNLLKMSWRKQRKSRWDCLKKETPKTESPKPVPTNNRWRRGPENPRETPKPNNSRFAPPVSPVRTGRAKNKELSWETILERDNTVEKTVDKISSLLNPCIPKEELDKTYHTLQYHRHNIREDERKMKRETARLHEEQAGILKRKDELKHQLKKIKLENYEDEHSDKKLVGYAVDMELRKKIKRDNRREEINQSMSRLKKKYMENKKTIKRNEVILKGYIRDFERITTRMEELLGQIRDNHEFNVKYVEPKIEKIETPIKKVVKVEITEYENTKPSEEPWWSNARAPKPVRYYDWSVAIKNVDLNIDCDDTVSEQSEVSSEDEDDTSEETVVKPPPNPYADLGEVELKKRIRSVNKKLRQITKLEQRTGLSKAELEKVKRREEFENELQLLNEVKQL